jgi:hypothetical protein
MIRRRSTEAALSVGDACMPRPAIPDDLVEVSRQDVAKLAKPRIIFGQPDLQRHLLCAVCSRDWSLCIP